jgi:hypothetical protein
MNTCNHPLALAGNKASQWQTLTIASLPYDEPDAQSNHTLLSTQLQPMRQLSHLNITEPVDSLSLDYSCRMLPQRQWESS